MGEREETTMKTKAAVGGFLRQMVGKRITKVRGLNESELRIEGADSGVIVEIDGGLQAIIVIDKAVYWQSMDHRVNLIDGSVE